MPENDYTHVTWRNGWRQALLFVVLVVLSGLDGVRL